MGMTSCEEKACLINGLVKSHKCIFGECRILTDLDGLSALFFRGLIKRPFWSKDAAESQWLRL